MVKCRYLIAFCSKPLCNSHCYECCIFFTQPQAKPVRHCSELCRKLQCLTKKHFKISLLPRRQSICTLPHENSLNIKAVLNNFLTRSVQIQVQNKLRDSFPAMCHTVELQWLKHLWDFENFFETGVVRANECKS